MKKFLLFIVSIIISCGINVNANDQTSIKQEYNSIQIGLQSEPIDLYGTGNYKTIFIRSREIKENSQELANQFGAYFQSFIFTINPNQCEKAVSKDGSLCNEVGSLELVAKFKNNNEIALFPFEDDSSRNKEGSKIPREFFLTDYETDEQIHLSIEIKRSTNYPGIDKQELFLIAKDKKGIRKAKLFPFLSHF